MVGTRDNPGIMVRALNHLFTEVENDRDSAHKVCVLLTASTVVFELSKSFSQLYLEIYPDKTDYYPLEAPKIVWERNLSKIKYDFSIKKIDF